MSIRSNEVKNNDSTATILMCSCGSHANIYKDLHIDLYIALCWECGRQGAIRMSGKEAVDDWNKMQAEDVASKVKK